METNDPTTAEAIILSEVPDAVMVDEDYEGRMPCIALTYEFTKSLPDPAGNRPKCKSRIFSAE